MAPASSRAINDTKEQAPGEKYNSIVGIARLSVSQGVPNYNLDFAK